MREQVDLCGARKFVVWQYQSRHTVRNFAGETTRTPTALWITAYSLISNHENDEAFLSVTRRGSSANYTSGPNGFDQLRCETPHKGPEKTEQHWRKQEILIRLAKYLSCFGKPYHGNLPLKSAHVTCANINFHVRPKIKAFNMNI